MSRLGQITDFIKNKAEYPLNDLYDMPSSNKTFPGGAHYRMEIPGVEVPSNMEVLVEESHKRNIPIHRVIGTVCGSALLDFQELKYMAEIGAQEKFEVLLNPMQSRGWDSGRQYTTPEGFVSGMRLRGQDALHLWLKELDRCLEAGHRGFLVPDEGILYVVNQLREEGIIPQETKFKVSVFAGHGNAVGGKLLEDMGADSYNPLGDLTLPMLAAIRQVNDIPLDVYMSLVNSMGGFQRHVESDEIARICAPVYFKWEPGVNEKDIYNAWAESDHLDHLVRLKVKYAQISKEWCEQSGYNLEFNDYKEDLAIPKP